MWNWKHLFEDKELVCYCDIDNITDPNADEDGIYVSVDYYYAIPKRTAAWMMFFIKNEGTINRYREQRKGMGLSIEGYENFNNVICLVELDSENYLYRVIPAGDYDRDGNELGASTIIGKKSFLKGMKAEWSPILKGKTHKSIFALFRFVYGVKDN
ncbi:MAG: hypothetical protein NTX36_03455 [Proteobacteria bacterium]|nr:hypothetical protein [Pseudomonadota bacterium]